MAGSHYTTNLLQPAIDSYQMDNFPIFWSNLQRPIPLWQLQRPETCVNEPLVFAVLYSTNSVIITLFYTNS